MIQNILHNRDCLSLIDNEDIPSESVDLIVTDPPYIKDLWESAYESLSQIAEYALKPSGFVITYAPQRHLFDIMKILDCGSSTGVSSNGYRGLEYFWNISSINDGATVLVHDRGALCLHKEILIFQKEPMKRPPRCFADVVKGRVQKKFHPWQQSIHDVLGVMDRFIDPDLEIRRNTVILDPFAGSGTSLLAAQLLGMNWLGYEIDPDTHKKAMYRLAQRPLTLSSEFTTPAPVTKAQRPRKVKA